MKFFIFLFFIGCLSLDDLGGNDNCNNFLKADLLDEELETSCYVLPKNNKSNYIKDLINFNLECLDNNYYYENIKNDIAFYSSEDKEMEYRRLENEKADEIIFKEYLEYKDKENDEYVEEFYYMLHSKIIKHNIFNDLITDDRILKGDVLFLSNNFFNFYNK